MTPPRGAGTVLFGGSGFLGPYILAANPGMISVGRTPPRTDNRHVQIESLADLGPLADVDFDRVIYIIGNTDHHHLEQETLDPDEPNAFDYHLTPLLQVMEQLKHRPIEKLVHCSTILIYDAERIRLPVDEHAPIDPYKNRYVLSKYLAEESCRFYSRWIPIVNVRFSNLYGPTPLERYDLIHVLCRRLLTEGRAEIWNDRPERDFIYVEDAADAIAKLVASDYTGTVNLGSGAMTSIRRVIDILQEVSGCPIEVRGEPVEGPMRFCCDTTTLSQAIDWRPTVSIEEGIRRTFESTRSLLEAGELAAG